MITKFGARGKHLFATAWRLAAHAPCPKGGDLFTACFGTRKVFAWYPLSNAIYWETEVPSDTDYMLNSCRIYRFRDGAWQEERYEKLYFHLDLLHAFLHEIDGLLRNYLKTGHYLRKKLEEAWATPYGEAAIRMDQQAEREAARPKITINLSSLEQIRQDAGITRDSLLTEEEMDSGPNIGLMPPAVDDTAGSELEQANSGQFGALDARHSRILLALLHGKPIEEMLKADHLMPSVVADTINEALFDEIGDNVLECDGDTITLVEDYRKDILQCMEAETNE